MSKIGTAHIEIKPVIGEGALNEIMDRVAGAVRAGVERGLNAVNRLDRGLIADQVHAEANRWLADREGRVGVNGPQYDSGATNGFIDGMTLAERIVRTGS